MKQRIIICLTAALVTMAACSTGDDDTTIAGINSENINDLTCKVQYMVNVDSIISTYYDLVVTYYDIDGKELSDTIKDGKWKYVSPMVPFNDAPDKFLCNIIGTKKVEVPKLTQDYYALCYQCDAVVAFSRNDGTIVRTIRSATPEAMNQLINKASFDDMLSSGNSLVICRLEGTKEVKD